MALKSVKLLACKLNASGLGPSSVMIEPSHKQKTVRVRTHGEREHEVQSKQIRCATHENHCSSARTYV